MASRFGTVAIPQHYRQEELDLDALLPHVKGRFFHDERQLPADWPADVAGLISDLIRVTSEFIDRLPQLQVISFAGTGVGDWVDVEHASRRGIAVCNVPDWGADSIAEFTFALLLAVAKRVLEGHRMARETEWREEAMIGLEVRGRTMGLVGLGHIGQRVAEIAQSFGLRVLCHTRHPEKRRQMKASVEFVSLDELLRRADILSLHTALTPETRGMIGARELSLLPPGAILINTARGPIVDTAALVEALRRGKLWGAGLDVFSEEPLPTGHPLKEMPNVVLSPHVAGQTVAAKRRRFAHSLSNVEAFAAGSPTNVINREALTG